MTYLLRRTCAACSSAFEVTMTVGEVWPATCPTCTLREQLRPTITVAAAQSHRVVRQRPPIVPLMSPSEES